MVEDRHVDREIVQQRLPTRQYRLVGHLAARHPPRRQTHALECRCTGLPDTLDRLKGTRVGIKHGSEGTEARDQRLGGRLGVALPDTREKEKFEQFVVGQRIVSARQQPLTQTGAMPRTGMFSRVVVPLRQPNPLSRVVR